MKKPFFALALMVVAMASGCASVERTTESKPSDTDKARQLLEMASAHITEGDGSGAIQTLDESKQLDDELPETYYLYALAYHLKGEKQLALEAAQKAVNLNPKFSQAKNTLGRIQMELGRYADAEKTLKEAASDLSYKESYLAKANLGILYYKRMAYEKAEPLLTAAIREGGESTCLAAYYRGMIHLEKNRLDYALSDFSRASKNGCARVTDAHLAKGQTLIRMRRYDQARAKMLEIQQLFPLSDAYDKAGQYLKEIP